MRNRSGFALVIGSLIFVALGLLFAQLGPVLAELATRTVSTLAAVGAVFTALYLGALVTQSVAGGAIDRAGSRPVLLVGLVVTATGMIGIALSRSLAVLLAWACFSGLGLGCLTIGTNVLVARTYAERSVSALNLVNVFYGAGAVAGPAVAGLAMHFWGTGLPAIWLGSALLLLLIPAVYLLPGGVPAGARSKAKASGGVGGRAVAQRGRTGAGGLYRSPLLWTMAALLLVYVGLESAVGGWTATYMQATTAVRLESAALVVSGYWLALTAGRLVNTWLGMRLNADQVLLLSLGGAVAGSVLIAASRGHVGLTIAGVLLLGFSFGAVFPTALAIVTGTFAPDAGKAASVAQAGGSFGGMTLPWMMGLILVKTGPSASMVFVAAGTLAMVALYLVARRLAPGGAESQGLGAIE